MRSQSTTSQHADCLDCEELPPDASAQIVRAHASAAGHTATVTNERTLTYFGEIEPEKVNLASAEVQFGRAVSNARNVLGWTQERLRREVHAAYRIDLSKTAMSRLEKGERPIRLNEVAAIAAVLGMDAKEILP